MIKRVERSAPPFVKPDRRCVTILRAEVERHFPLGLVLAVDEVHIQGAVGGYFGDRELILVALTSRSRFLIGAEVGVAARDLLGLEPRGPLTLGVSPGLVQTGSDSRLICWLRVYDNLDPITLLYTVAKYPPKIHEGRFDFRFI